MPIAGQTPKQTMETELHKFKQGTLHSGSKTGPRVTNRKQAIAIGLSESGQARDRATHGSLPFTDKELQQGYRRIP